MNSSESLYQWHSLSVGLTSLCNLRCKMCPVIHREKHSLTRDQAFHVADFAKRRGFQRIIVGGGEPTMMDYFWDFLERLANANLEVWVLTNAVKLSEQDVSRFARMPQLIVNVSMDGVGSVHDEIRGEGMFAASDAAIRRLLAAGVRVAVNTVVQQSNFRYMEETYEHFRKYCLEWHGFGYAEPFHGHEVVPAQDMDESLAVLSRVQRRSDAEGGKTVLSHEMLKGFYLQYRYPLLPMHPGRGCTIPRRLLALDETGLVLPCWHFPGWAKKPYRDLNRHSLDEIVDSIEVRQEIERAIGPGGCRGCSTMCYFWDEDFRRKTMRPSGMLRLRRVVLHAKEYLRTQHPGVFRVLRKLKEMPPR